uniref:2Fe-2S ferredoxin-type domain-containing protein n=1 Tax=Naja naja TaxID=35670 RepID=A0A8C6Y073_NAJNA
SHLMILKFPSRNIHETITNLEMDARVEDSKGHIPSSEGPPLNSPLGSFAETNRESAQVDHVRLHFINRDGEKYSVSAKEGESLLEVVIKQNINIDGFGACEGTLSCSTCHLIFEKAAFQQLGEISDDELDMLDLAYGLTDTSRLGCQVCVKKWMDGLTVQVPTEVSDIRRELESSPA